MKIIIKNVAIFLGCLALFASLNSCGRKPSLVVLTKDIQAFEGRYLLNNGGFLELINNGNNQISILSQGQLIVSVNPENDTLAEHPRLSGYNLQLDNNQLRIVRNFNYTSGQDLEEDLSGSNILGLRRTDIFISKTTTGITINISIYSAALNANANSVVANRVIRGY